MVITISSVVVPQPPFDTVQRKVADAPTVKPVTPDVDDAGVVIVATPLTTDHKPLPTVGVLPANVVVVTLQRF